MAERLLDDHPRPASLVAPLAQGLDDRRERRRRDGEIEDAVAVELLLLVEPRQQRVQRVLAARVGEVETQVAERRGELVPDVVAERVAAVLLHRGLHVGPKGVVVAVGAGDADDGEARRQQAADGERVQRRHQLLVGQVAGGAEDHERARIGGAAQRQPLRERVRRRGGLVRRRHQLGALRLPRRLDRVAAELVAQRGRDLGARSSSRRATRTARTAPPRITGAGTFSAIASWIVQRPSPESST